MTAAAPVQRSLRTVEAGRGLAALAVVLFHASSSIFPAAKYWHAALFGGVLDWGYAGVYFFFVLSGFIIVQVHAGDVGRPERLRRYGLRRLVRIYPLYWLVLAGLVVLQRAGVGDSVPASTAMIASSVLLVGPDNQATVIAVAWTLYHEIAFYLVFATWLVSARLGAAVTALWLATIAAGAVMALPVPAYVASPLNLLFGYGVLAWWAARRWALPGWLAVAGIAAFVAVGLDAVWWHRLALGQAQQVFGLAAAVTLAALVSVERRRRIVVPGVLPLLGAASYSIYLTHFPLLSLAAKLCVRLGIVGAVPATLAFVGVVAAVVAAGIAVHRLVERPLLAAIGARVLPRAG